MNLNTQKTHFFKNSRQIHLKHRIAFFLLIILFASESIFASDSSSQILCRSYFEGADLRQDWSDGDFAAFYNSILTFIRLEGKADADNLRAKADLQTQLLQFQKRKGYSFQQRLNFSKLFQQHIREYKQLMQKAAERQAQQLAVEDQNRTQHFKEEASRLLRLKSIFVKYNVHTVDEALFASCDFWDNKNVSEIEFLIAAGADVNYINQLKESTLGNAVRTQFTEAVQVLLRNGALVEVTDIDERTPLLNASANGNIESIEIVRLLLQAGAKSDQVDKYQNTAQIYASMHGHLDILKLLMSQDIHLNIKNDMYFKAAHSAIEQRKVNTALFLVESGVMVNRSLYGDTLLTLAIFKNLEPVVRSLLEANADTSLTTAEGKTPLMLAEDKPVIKKMLRSAVQQRRNLGRFHENK